MHYWFSPIPLRQFFPLLASYGVCTDDPQQRSRQAGQPGCAIQSPPTAVSLFSLLYRYLHDSTQSAIGFRPSSSSATSPERRKLYGNLRTCVRTAVWRLAKETYDLGQRAVEAGEREKERPTRRTTKGTCLCTWQRQRMEKRERKRENNNRERKVETKMEQSTRLAVGPSISWRCQVTDNNQTTRQDHEHSRGPVVRISRQSIELNPIKTLQGIAPTRQQCKIAVTLTSKEQR